MSQDFTVSFMRMSFPHGAMVGCADFQPNSRRQRCGQSEPRTKDANNHWVAWFDDLNPPTDANAERLEALRIVAAGFNAAHDGALPGGKLVEPLFGGHRGCRHFHTP